ncbi:MAG: DUF4177 domain-containing protein [Anaeromyxobacter sp.]
MVTSKRFVDGKWRWVRPDGSVGRVCPPPNASERRNLEAAEKPRAAAPAPAKAFVEGRWHWLEPDGAVGRPCPKPNAAERRDLEAGKERAPVVTAWTPPALAAAPAAGPARYKVLSQRDAASGGKFDPARLEAALNARAAEGWRVVGVSSADAGGRAGGRQELVIVLERA